MRMSKIKIIGRMDHTIDNTFESANRVYDVQGICPTIPTCSGGGLQPKIMEVIKLQKVDTKVLQMVRTEEGKRLRKDYESGKPHHGFNEYREPIPREDGICNTITTVAKDNYLLEVKQATQKGYIECEVGGSGSELPILSNKKRSSHRERKDMSNLNNGEYP